MRRGQLWESTAVPEIRAQATGLAEAIIADLPEAKARRRPRDVYGLPLSASHEAARLYDAALARILRVQTGAPSLIADAVTADPGFALGHAALALLGHEWGAPGMTWPTPRRRAAVVRQRPTNVSSSSSASPPTASSIRARVRPAR